MLGDPEVGLRREELAHAPVAGVEQLVRPEDIVDLDRGRRADMRRPRLEDGEALGGAVRAHDRHHPALRRALDGAHEPAIEDAAARGAVHPCETPHVHDAPIHAWHTGRSDASGWHGSVCGMRELARAWIAIGTQSVGGGTSTLFLIRRLVVERHAWVTVRAFTEDWALSQLSPGIHLVALAGLLGDRIAGWRGVVISVAGMMVPAAMVTAALTAAYGTVADQPLARAALAGMAPATGGMTLALALIMVRETRRHGRAVIIDALVVAAAFAILTFTRASSILVIVSAALLGSAFLRRERPTSERVAE